ncbi:uncharacterized protein F5Z01DRAFT_116813 [Emericellopsis atlantica]|uniref:SRR1-like domain-containing protein n=1 Tax=Emericellopsis atlantica TaxID=2614577 RepID=A0A9P7ZLV4_9HYPO|nr:uncharacterized protein F5Z01DRAFT_116813 [Emericellopsis atlantica]KAG9254092.1 hypothetical protein F5Z01DRAFT_116813 [Emericellopsis atlantica]
MSQSITATATPLDDGWTVVKPKSRQRAPKLRPKSRQILAQASASASQADVKRVRSIAEITAQYDRIRTQYESEASYTKLRDLVKEHAPKKGVKKAVCLGIGTFDPVDGGWEMKKKAFIQLAAFLLMVQVLEHQSHTSIDCAFQEPVFTTSDKEFIKSLGHRVVDSPEGFDMVGQDTLLFGIHLYRPIYIQAMEKATPIMFVGTELDVWDTLSIDKKDDILDVPTIKQMSQTHSKHTFPKDDTTNSFTNTAVYCKEAS